MDNFFTLNGKKVETTGSMTVLQAALAAGLNIRGLILNGEVVSSPNRTLINAGDVITTSDYVPPEEPKGTPTQ